ncbi:hypothetical protein BABINDRAFT_6256 [Babjeviella inositovora NRRL Y-12698]|uniref:Lethal giant larvae (Lgl)-like C-terminal domain-containing protein n=1 Tax=Babjeviella inositovora NRRL Y-12698 TaxID=984486 RepID=A0A1E3QVC4_9ASCO|nr:uncharacterized protein BABINDRAFT_6256 [Babjeviella inositovora NRRL Y-12698]ODQ81574.1 hypothetical protein BABINDRAFT_6256 [Babjeviella inositovora NRRL Y-12698]
MSREWSVRFGAHLYLTLSKTSTYQTPSSLNSSNSFAMFNKFKTKTDKLSVPSAIKSVSSVTNAIKTVRQTDLSDKLSSASFQLDDLARYGVDGLIDGMGFDPVQSLLAVSTSAGQIHVYGQHQVAVTLETPTPNPVITLKFVKGVYLVAIDSEDTILVYSLESKKLLSNYKAAAAIISVESDPSLDWLLLGLATGIVVAFDVDRFSLAPFKIANLTHPRGRIVSLKWHPRELGTLLVATTDAVHIYSVATEEVKQTFAYAIPAGAPGGGDRDGTRNPTVTNALWHPNGLNIVSFYEDNSLVFWDAVSGQLLQARTLYDTYVDRATTRLTCPVVEQTPIIKVCWITGENPDVTSLVMLGGEINFDGGVHSLTVMHFGAAPTYSITSYEKMAEYYAHPASHKQIPLHTTSQIIDFLPLPRLSPHFNGSHNPSHLLVLQDDGQLQLMDCDTWGSDTRACKLPPDLTYLLPASTCIAATEIERNAWLNMVSAALKAQRSAQILQGGLPTKRPVRLYGMRSVMITGHANGSVRLWDASYGEIDETAVLETNLGDVLQGIATHVAISRVSYATDVAEMSVAMGSGVAMLKFGRNVRYSAAAAWGSVDTMRKLVVNEHSMCDLVQRYPNVKEGLLPTHYFQRPGVVTALKHSGIGLIAVGYESGQLIIIDNRGPAVIFDKNIGKYGDRGAVTAVEFSIMQHEDDTYSSILCYVGTAPGGLFAFKILPDREGRYMARFVGLALSEGSAIHSITTLNAETGESAAALLKHFETLGAGVVVPPMIIVASSRSVRVLRGLKTKVAQRSFDVRVLGCGTVTVHVDLSRDPANPTYTPRTAVVLTLVDSVRVLSVPELRDLQTLSLPFGVSAADAAYNVTVLPCGDVVLRKSATSVALVSILGKGITQHTYPPDVLFNRKMYLPPRPTMNVMSYARGSKPLTRDQLNEAMGGPKRRKGTILEVELGDKIVAGTAIYAPRETQEYEQVGNYERKNAYSAAATRNFNGLVRSVQSGIDTVNERLNTAGALASQKADEANDAIVKGAFKSKFGMS